jgi:hypothetical protein
MKTPDRGIPVLVAALVVVLGLAGLASEAEARKSKRYGIEGEFVSYDAERQVFRVKVLSRETRRFGGSVAGEEAPESLPVREEVEFSVKPEGSVLSRTVIKAVDGTGLDNSGTQEGFERAVAAIPSDKRLVFSIEKNGAASKGAPEYRIRTVIIQLSEAELRQRLEEFLEDD